MQFFVQILFKEFFRLYDDGSSLKTTLTLARFVLADKRTVIIEYLTG